VTGVLVGSRGGPPRNSRGGYLRGRRLERSRRVGWVGWVGMRVVNRGSLTANACLLARYSVAPGLDVTRAVLRASGP
jgi:hypothetical protein